MTRMLVNYIYIGRLVPKCLRAFGGANKFALNVVTFMLTQSAGLGFFH